MSQGNFHGEMSLLEHIRELRKKLIISAVAFVLSMAVAFVGYDYIVVLLKKPFEEIESSGNATLFMHSILEGFLMKIKLSVLTGLVISFPVHVYNAVRFILPGLKKKEKLVVGWMLFASTFLILGGAIFSYQKIIPLSVQFLNSASFKPPGVGTMLNYGQNITYIFQFFIFSLILFQLPLVLEILMTLNLVSRRTMWKNSRYIIVSIFVLSALVTPPDPVSQLSIAMPLVALFYLSLVIAKIFRLGEQ